MKTGNAQKQMTPGQQRELYIRVLAALPLDMNRELAKEWMKRPKILSKVFEKVMSLEWWIWDWQIFLKKYFNVSLDLSNLKVPPKQEGFDRPIIMPQGIGTNRICQVCKEHFPSWYQCEEDLEKAIVHNDREPKETYLIWTRDRQEADKENKISAEQAWEKGIKGQIVGERLMQGLKYWDETGEHLDVKNATICSGSRSSDGNVLTVNCYDGEVSVSWCYSHYATSLRRVRTVVSF